MNYALLADNSFQVEKELVKIKKDLCSKMETEVIEINGQDKSCSVDSVLNDLNTVPWLFEHRVLILNNPIFLSAKGSIDEASIKALEDYLKSPAPFSSLIIYVDQFKVDNRKKATKVIKKHMKVFEPKALDESMMKHLIDQDLKERNIQMEFNAKELLYKRVLAEFDNWPQEIIKLELYGKKTLSEDDIKVLISESSLNTVFDLSNSVLKKDLNQALTIIKSLDASDKEPIALIMLLASQFRLIHQIQTLMNAQVPYTEIASKIKVHPYRVQVLRPTVNAYTSLETLSILDKLSQLEQDIKGGKVDPVLGFELFLIGVCTT